MSRHSHKLYPKTRVSLRRYKHRYHEAHNLPPPTEEELQLFEDETAAALFNDQGEVSDLTEIS